MTKTLWQFLESCVSLLWVTANNPQEHSRTTWLMRSPPLCLYLSILQETGSLKTSNSRESWSSPIPSFCRWGDCDLRWKSNLLGVMQQVSSRLTLTSDLLGAGTRCPLETSKGRHDPLLTHWVLAFLSFFTQVRKESDAHLSVHMLYFFHGGLKTHLNVHLTY